MGCCAFGKNLLMALRPAVGNRKRLAPFVVVLKREDQLDLLRPITPSTLQDRQGLANPGEPRIARHRSIRPVETVERGGDLQQLGAHLKKDAVKDFRGAQRRRHDGFRLSPTSSPTSGGTRATPPHPGGMPTLSVGTAASAPAQIPALSFKRELVEIKSQLAGSLEWLSPREIAFVRSG